MIEIKNLFKSYKDKKVLQDVTLTIDDSAVLGLVGINGAGKSTLLRLLSGVLNADGGSILIDGEPVYENEKVKSGIFFLPDDPYYGSGVTGDSLIKLYRQFYTFNDSVFDEYMQKFSLNPQKHIRNFSKGMKRQLFVSIALACKPKYLFLDEAFDGLDPLARLEFKRGIIELQQEGSTVVIASHSLRELEDICDSFALLDNSSVKSYGKIDGALDKIVKLQIVFDREVLREELPLNLVKFERTGRVVRIVARGEKQEIMDRISAMHPAVIDEIPMDFEDLFIAEVEDKGYLK
ncbi:MAG: ABC transporter ATP-binding protein [Clostridia bacterium]|nr:ABC transporter ATP-binding protein [Clostridia bacterium]